MIDKLPGQKLATDLFLIVGKGALLEWIPKLPRLRNMNIWDGEALRGTGSLIRAHCPNFAELKFWGW